MVVSGSCLMEFQKPFKGFMSGFVGVLVELPGIQGNFSSIRGISGTFHGD